MPKRALVLVAALCFALPACGGRAEQAGPPDRPSGATRSVELPEPIPAVPAYRVELREAVPETVREQMEQLPGVAIVTAIATEQMNVEGPKGTVELTVGSTRPLRFRAVAPAPTKEAEFVWTSLLGGRTVLTFETADDLGIETGGEIELGGEELRIGAFAANGTPDVADIMVADHVGRDLGMGSGDVWLVGAEPGSPLDALGDRLRGALRDYDVRIESVPGTEPAQANPVEQPQAVSSGSVIGAMRFRILKDGFIEPDDAWVAANIASAEVALLGSVTCHRLVIPQLHAAMTEIIEEGLGSEVREYGGCYVPRFIDRDPKKPLSMHAFGLAFDINTSTNQLGTQGDMHPRVVEILERWGFEWGGRWRPRPDPMHFEMVRLVET
jgi:hypothetical protein